MPSGLTVVLVPMTATSLPGRGCAQGTLTENSRAAIFQKEMPQGFAIFGFPPATQVTGGDGAVPARH
jgi:hypothetical protein